MALVKEQPGPWFNIKMSSYQYRKSHCGNKTILRPSYLHNGISYTAKMSSLYWIRAQVATCLLTPWLLPGDQPSLAAHQQADFTLEKGSIFKAL